MSLAPRSKRRPSEPAPKKTYGTKKCKNCDRRFTRERANQEFCKIAKDGTPSQCKAEFHRNRSAFGPLKGRIEGMIREQTKLLRATIVQLQKNIDGLQLPELRARVTALELKQPDNGAAYPRISPQPSRDQQA